jgi:tartrate-resistant acid phosphatase type 5
MQRFVAIVCLTTSCLGRTMLEPGEAAGAGVSAEDSATPGPGTRFAVIGDYGSAGQAESQVADLVLGFEPDFIITTGDNNYPSGAAETIDENVGQYFHAFIAPYGGTYGAGAETNRFFPTLGNHDWITPGAEPYLDYFALPNNERYYDVAWGDVHLFALDSDQLEPDGIDEDSLQAAWLEQRLAASSARWKIVYLHHPPYSSGPHGSSVELRWPFRKWGASIVYAGHDHIYERLLIEEMPYVVNGVGGKERYTIAARIAGSLVAFDNVHGAVLVTADQNELASRFVTSDGRVFDELYLKAP